MTASTARTRVFTMALQRSLRKEEAITSHEIAKAADTSERTARDCLKALVGVGFLKERRDPDGSVRYLPAVKIEAI